MRVLNIFTRFHATDGIATHTVDLAEALSFAACEVSFLSGMVDFTEETKWKVARLENTCKTFQIDPDPRGRHADAGKGRRRNDGLDGYQRKGAAL